MYIQNPNTGIKKLGLYYDKINYEILFDSFFQNFNWVK